MDVTDLLMEDHRTVEELFSEYEISQDPAILEQICDELEIHATLEEELVYPELAQLSSELEEHAEAEHGLARELIRRIRRGDDDNYALARKLKQAVEDHVEEEESKAFPLMRREFGDELEIIGQSVLERKEELLFGSAQ